MEPAGHVLGFPKGAVLADDDDASGCWCRGGVEGALPLCAGLLLATGALFGTYSIDLFLGGLSPSSEPLWTGVLTGSSALSCAGSPSPPLPSDIGGNIATVGSAAVDHHAGAPLEQKRLFIYLF